MKFTLQAIHEGVLKRNTYQGFTRAEALKHFRTHVARGIPVRDIQTVR